MISFILLMSLVIQTITYVKELSFFYLLIFVVDIVQLWPNKYCIELTKRRGVTVKRIRLSDLIRAFFYGHDLCYQFGASNDIACKKFPTIFQYNINLIAFIK